MNDGLNNPSTLSIVPLGAGDLIDRAVRLYRRHFVTLIRIAAPPVTVSAVGSILLSVAIRQLTTTTTELSVLWLILVLLTAVVLIVAGSIFSLIVMGGATRNLVTYLLWNERVSVRATYAAIRSRFWALLLATLLMLIWVGFMGGFALLATYIVFAIFAFGAVMLALGTFSWIAALVGIVGGIAAAVLGLWLFFLLAGRVAYVPQALLVEGKGVVDAVARSFALARGNVRRLMAMVVFTSFATYSALMILVAPLTLLGWVNGVNVSPTGSADWPAWYLISYNVIAETSKILLAPIWMMGLSLLYVDERVRHEAYDVELLAARQLSEMPELDVSSPLAPAIANQVARKTTPPPPPMPTGRVLGLS